MRVYGAQWELTPLMAAAAGGHLHVVTALLAAGANKEGFNDVMRAAGCVHALDRARQVWLPPECVTCARVWRADGADPADGGGGGWAPPCGHSSTRCGREQGGG